MAKKKTSPAKKKTLKPKKDEGTQFTVDLKSVKLTKREVSSLKNKFTKMAIATSSAAKSKAVAKREPYAEIIFFRQISPYPRVVFSKAAR
jgi:hypothetical protein